MVFTGLWTFIVVQAGQYLTDGRHGTGRNPVIGGDKGSVEWLLTLLLLVLTLVFWAITYVRLKEKEV